MVRRALPTSPFRVLLVEDLDIKSVWKVFTKDQHLDESETC